MNPKRRFFQIHLSTAVVLMLVAGVLVWANVRPDHRTWKIGSRPGPGNLIEEWRFDAFGWPFECAREPGPRPDWFDGTIVTWSRDNAGYSALIAFAILLSVCVACEWLIRRRAARKANE